MASGLSSESVETMGQVLLDSSGNASTDRAGSALQFSHLTSIIDPGHGSLEPANLHENSIDNYSRIVQGQGSSRENVGLRLHERQSSTDQVHNFLPGRYRNLINEMEVVEAELTNCARAAETFYHVMITSIVASRIQRQIRQLDEATQCVLWQQTTSGGTRKPLEGECLICQQLILMHQSVAWCRACCGYNFHKECMESWKSVRGAQVDCPHW